MQARMKTIASGPGLNVKPGDIVEGDVAETMVAAGYAAAVGEVVAPPVDAPVEAATAVPTERAVAPAAKPRRSGRGR